MQLENASFLSSCKTSHTELKQRERILVCDHFWNVQGGPSTVYHETILVVSSIF